MTLLKEAFKKLVNILNRIVELFLSGYYKIGNWFENRVNQAKIMADSKECQPAPTIPIIRNRIHIHPMRLLAILAIILWAYQAGAFDSTPGIKEAVELSIHIINEGLSFVMMLLERLFIHVKPQEHWDIFNEWFFNTIPF